MVSRTSGLATTSLANNYENTVFLHTIQKFFSCSVFHIVQSRYTMVEKVELRTVFENWEMFSS